MATNDNYIGVAMGLDVSDLKSGLAEASKRIGEANADFREASSSMEDWTKSTEGLQAKLKQLDTVLGAQKSKLAGLKAEYEKVAAEQGENSTAARNLYIRMQNQQAVVNQTQREFDNYTETLKQAEAGTIDLTQATLKNGKAMTQAGDGAKTAGGKMSGIVGVAGGVVGAIAAIGAAAVAAVGGFLSLAESTRETRENFNKLETGFTTAGHSAEDASKTYRELYGILGDEGQATEAAAHLALLTNNQEELAQWTDIATGVYATFGESLPIESLTEAANETAKTGAITGSLADALNWAGVSEDEFQASLDACSTEQERQALITETLNGLYSEQSDKFKELNSDIIAAREADAELSQAMAELGAIAEPIMTSLKLLAVDLLGAIKPFVELIGTGLKGALEGTEGAADKLAEGIGGLIGVILEKVQGLLPKILEMILSLVPQAVSTILGALPQIFEALVSIVTMVLENLPSLVGQILNAVLTVLPLLVTSIVQALPTLIQSIFSFVFMVIGDLLPTLISQILTTIPTIVTSLIDGIVTAIPVLINSVIDLLILLVSDVLPTLISEISAAIPQIINSIVDGLLGALPQILEAAITLLFAIIDAIPVLVKSLYKEIPTLVVTIITTLLSKIPDIYLTAWKLLFAIVEAVPQIAWELLKAIPAIYKSAITGLIEGVPAMKKAGLNMLEGIWEGIKGGAKWLKDKISGFAGDVAGWFKKAFKISSPSQLIEDEVGVDVGRAVVPSRPAALAKVKKSLGDFAGFVSDNLGGIKSGLSYGTAGGYAVAGANAGGGSTVINAGMTVNYNGRLSLKETKRLEQNHYTTIKMNLKKEGAIS